jgi:predicted Ser/Thr protein kinase
MARDTHIGSIVAGYRIERLLGRGGMSVVYLAEQDFPRRKVALKVMAPELAEDEGFRDRFIRESNAAAALDHPNVIPIYGAGDEDGLLWLAMRFVDGIDLGRLIEREGRLESERAATLVSQVASALDAAHEMGLTHRDVKPANVLLARGDHAYLTDFGLTKRRDSGTDFTKTGQFLGSVDYAAPEQFRGDEVDARADVYSLTCVLFECLTGEPPYRREVEVASMYAHLQEPAPKATARAPVPAAIDAVIARGMRKRPADRYPSAGALGSAARAALAPAKATPSTGGRRPVAALLGGALAVLLVVLVALALGRHPAAPSGRPSGGSSESSGPIRLTLTAGDLELEGLVPRAIRANCRPAEAPSSAATASISCLDGPVGVTYSRFSERGAMYRTFQDSARSLGIESGSCATDIRAEAAYTIGGEPTGQLVCYRETNRSHIEWTDDRTLIYATGTRPDIADQTLYEWWATEAGPNGAPGSAEVDQKDVPTLRTLEGTFRVTLGKRDVEPPGAAPGHYVLFIHGNHWRTSGPEGYGPGYLVWAKGSEVGLFDVGSVRRSVACSLSFYRWREGGGILIFHPLGRDPCHNGHMNDMLSAKGWTGA